ncbi:MAG: hypothetical protein IJV77_03855 [Clostridia bacterium]|nr:hypothetical protein [Clostridia bacterium]
MSSAEVKYLLTIFNLSFGKQGVRPVDIADELEYSRASVSKMVDNLQYQGILTRNKDKSVSFTQKGEVVAQKYCNAFCKVKNFLIKTFDCHENVATKDAIKIVSVLSEQIINKLV